MTFCLQKNSLCLLAVVPGPRDWWWLAIPSLTHCAVNLCSSSDGFPSGWMQPLGFAPISPPQEGENWNSSKNSSSSYLCPISPRDCLFFLLNTYGSSSRKDLGAWACREEMEGDREAGMGWQRSQWGLHSPALCWRGEEIRWNSNCGAAALGMFPLTAMSAKGLFA